MKREPKGRRDPLSASAEGSFAERREALYGPLVKRACCQEWISVQLCATPDDMAETLLEHLTNYLEYKATLGRRELTEDDLAQVEEQRQIMLEKLQ